MNKQKQTYLSPETETLVVRFEGVICTSDPLVLGAIQLNGTRQGNVLDASDYGFDDWD